ncbi:hypothetical protein DFA_03231 [Cavenderia fasciculata]|uniref:Rab GTPase n=1 Tax=Cavenderia fasciculata TaxID=261658 RepID=F4PH01_CACFS|nr:uncharacterized protein DFA_03231 [Cavenderia fasciculata]EGG24985.1 hypothetical protein DFA_03231 [Cavenderia fasciculata]|eukprot:XP_004362836.1 hypothetical protein DFA_03231 [Cavenderia fasciculata]
MIDELTFKTIVFYLKSCQRTLSDRSRYRLSILFVVYDITSKKCFDNLSTCFELAKGNLDGNIIVLVGTKSDLYHRRAVPKQKVIEFAQSNGIYNYFESNHNDPRSDIFGQILFDNFNKYEIIRLHSSQRDSISQISPFKGC